LNRLSACFFSVLAAMMMSQAASAEEAVPLYASKIVFRTSNGVIANEGSIGGTSSISGGMNVSYLHYPSAQWALGAGYRADFDYTNKSTLLSGVFTLARWYFYGSGTRVTEPSTRMTSEWLDDFGLYLGPQLAYTSYYFGLSPVDPNKEDMLAGNFLSIDGLAGLDFRFSRHFEVNVEGALGLSAFSHSDPRFRIRALLFTFGISYLW